MYGAAQAGDAAVNVRDVGLAAQTQHDLTGQFIVAAVLTLGLLACVDILTGVQLDLAVVAARGHIIELLNHEREYEVVQDEVDDTDNRNPQPAGLLVALHDTEQGQVDQAAREGQANADVQDVHDHIGCACEDTVYNVHCRSYKQEGELQRLGDTGQHGGQCSRQQQAADNLTVFRLCAAVERQRCTGQAEDHERELTSHEASCLNREVLDARGCQLGKEDVLCTLDQLAADHCRAAERGLPERDIEYMVQAERDERTLDEAVQPGACVARCENEAAQGVDTGLDDRPDVVHRDTDNQINRSRDDRDKAGAAEEGQYLRQLNLVILIVQGGNAEADQNTAEYAHLQRVDADNACGCTGQVRCAEVGNHRADGRMHDEECNRCRQCCDFLLLLGHTDGRAHGEDNGQVAEYDRACRVEYLQDGIDEGTRAHDAHQPVGFEHGLIGERSADA